MNLKLLTLPFSPAQGRFDDSPLTAHLRDHELVACRTRLFFSGGLPYLLCVVTTGPTREPVETEPPSPRNAAPDVRPDPEHQALFDDLRAWRNERAKADGLPPYAILTNQALATIARVRPATRAGLLRVPGLGEKKLARYGRELLHRVAVAGSHDTPDAVPAQSIDGPCEDRT